MRYGVRSLAKNPGFAIVAILTLALGIGANTAIFSVVDGVLLKPLPFDHPDEIVWFQDLWPHVSSGPFSAPEFATYRDQNQTLSQIAAFRMLKSHSHGPRLCGIVASRRRTQYFPLIRVAPAIGRDFTEADGKSGAQRVAILTDGYWKTAFGGDANAIGQTLALNGESVTIVGILPKDYIIPGSVSIFMNPKFGVPEVFPGGPDPSAAPAHFIRILGRLKPNTTLAQSQAELSAIIRDLNKATNVSSEKAHAVRIIPWTQLWIGDSRSTLLTLLAVVGVVLLIAWEATLRISSCSIGFPHARDCRSRCHGCHIMASGASTHHRRRAARIFRRASEPASCLCGSKRLRRRKALWHPETFCGSDRRTRTALYICRRCARGNYFSDWFQLFVACVSAQGNR